MEKIISKIYTSEQYKNNWKKIVSLNIEEYKKLLKQLENKKIYEVIDYEDDGYNTYYIIGKKNNINIYIDGIGYSKTIRFLSKDFIDTLTKLVSIVETNGMSLWV